MGVPKWEPNFGNYPCHGLPPKSCSASVLVPVGGSCGREIFGFAGLWLAGNEGTEKKMETTVLG